MTGTRDIRLDDGGRLRATAQGANGTAPWLVFVNSVLTDHSIWDAQAEAFGGAYRTLRYDQRGHGGSSVPAGPVTFELLAADLFAVMDAFGVERGIVVGLSMGVPTALAAFAREPERFERLVFVDGISRSAPTGRAFWEERIALARAEGMAEIARQTVRRWLPPADAEGAAGRRLAEIVAATPLGGFEACARALQGYDFADVAPGIRCPVLAVAGAEDGAIAAAMREQLARVPDIRFETVPGAGHLPCFQRPGTFNRILRRFLEAGS